MQPGPLLLPNSSPLLSRAGKSLCCYGTCSGFSIPREKNKKTVFSFFFPFLWFHDLLQKIESLHDFSFTTSILHSLGFLPEQMAAAACRSQLVSVKVMLSGFSSSVVGTRKCSFHINRRYALNKEYLKLAESKMFSLGRSHYCRNVKVCRTL